MKLYNKFIFPKIKNNRQNYIKKYNKRNPRSRIIDTKLYSQRMMQKNYSEIVKDTQDQEKQKIRSLTGKKKRKRRETLVAFPESKNKKKNERTYHSLFV